MPLFAAPKLIDLDLSPYIPSKFDLLKTHFYFTSARRWTLLLLKPGKKIKLQEMMLCCMLVPLSV